MDNDQEALDSLVKHNLRLVLTVINRLKINGDIEDMFQIGCIGLIDAIKGFNLDYNIKFSTYAFPMVGGTIRTHTAKDKSVRAPRRIQDNLYKIYTGNKKLINELKREPTHEELTRKTGLTSVEISEAQLSRNNVNSLFETTVNSDDGNSAQIIDILDNGEETQDTHVDSIWLKESIEKLNKREQIILKGLYFEGRNQKEMAKIIGVSQAQISRIRTVALNKLKSIVS